MADNNHQTTNVGDETINQMQIDELQKNIQNQVPNLTNQQNQEQNEVPIKQNQSDLQSQTSEGKPKPKKATIFGTTLTITNICMGTTIFTFAVRAKSFGLVWILFFCFVVAAVNYWSIMRCVYASNTCKENDFSEITKKLMGNKARNILNAIIILYSYTTLMCLIAIIYPLFGRFIQSAFYRNTYKDYDDFYDQKWGKLYIKLPFFAGLAFLLSLICLIKDINKMAFTSIIGVGAVIYTLLIVIIQCHSYYKHYKNTVYVKEDKETHVNWYDLGKAFTSKLDFFKGITSFIFAYACQSGIFPLFAGFKNQEDGVKKMRISTIFATILTTILHVISIVCAFLTDPITPEDLIIYRKNKGTGRDIAMVIARLLVSISLFFTIPGNYVPLRLSIANVFTGGKISNKFNILFTFISIFCCSIISAIYDKILNYITYVGFIAVFISFLYPALLHAKSTGKKLTYWRNLLDIALAIIMCAIGLIAGIATLIDDIK